MLKKIKIEGYRGIRLLELDNLTRVNILLGENGSGKTTVLEAISLMSNPTPYQHLKLANLRDMPTPKLGENNDALNSIFFADRQFKAACLTARYDEGKMGSYQQTMKIKPLKIADNYPINFEFEDANGSLNLDISDNTLVGIEHLIFINNEPCSEQTLLLNSKGGKISARSGRQACDGEIEFNGSFFIDARRSIHKESASMISRLFQSLADKKRFMAALKSVAKELVDIQIGFHNNSPTIYADIGQDRLTSINALGDGFNRIFLIMTGCFMGKQLVLVDEIDSGLHYSVMDKVWQDIYTLMGNGMQLFCATHNDEMLRSTLPAFEGSKEQLQIIRLDRAPSGVVTPIYYTLEEYKKAAEFGFDVR